MDADDFGVKQGVGLSDTELAEGVEAPVADVEAQPLAVPVSSVHAADAGTLPLFLSTPSPAERPPLKPDTDEEEEPLQLLLSAPQKDERKEATAAGGLTADEWSVPLSMVESVSDGAASSAACVCVHPTVFQSPLTLKAVEATTAVMAGPSGPATRRKLRPRGHEAASAGNDDIILNAGCVPVKRCDFRCLSPGE